MQLPDDVVHDLRKRLRRAEGQVRAVESMLAEGRECRDIVTQMSAAIAALEQTAFGIFIGPEFGTVSRADLVEAYRFDGDQALLVRGEGLAVGDRVRAVVPWAVRFPTTANHTATHLLQQALRDVLGEIHQIVPGNGLLVDLGPPITTPLEPFPPVVDDQP